MTKLISRTYRFSQATLNQIEWLQTHLGGMDATNVLRVAVSELYDRKQSQWKARLVELDPGNYALQIRGQTLLQISDTALDRFPEDERAAMMQTEVDGLSAMAKLLLVAAAGEDEIWLDQDYLDELGGELK
ncbi:MAG: hypothetical protein H8D37_00965 [Chloroflexi bacterium]|nr:hypothetical protein [Chloroflexota bacterium]